MSALRRPLSHPPFTLFSHTFDTVRGERSRPALPPRAERSCNYSCCRRHHPQTPIPGWSRPASRPLPATLSCRSPGLPIGCGGSPRPQEAAPPLLSPSRPVTCCSGSSPGWRRVEAEGMRRVPIGQLEPPVASGLAGRGSRGRGRVGASGGC